jgi:hypothetical protein
VPDPESGESTDDDERKKPGRRTVSSPRIYLHARRDFVEAPDGGDLRAAIAVKLIEKMYEVEAEATKARASPDERLAMRHERTSPLLDELGQWIAGAYQELRPKSPRAKAMGYAMRQWTALWRVLAEGRMPLDNGEPERRLRDVSTGHRNDLFAGSDTGAERAAAADFDPRRMRPRRRGARGLPRRASCRASSTDGR